MGRVVSSGKTVRRTGETAPLLYFFGMYSVDLIFAIKNDINTLGCANYIQMMERRS